MKCPVCGYIHEDEWEREDSVEIGDERFVRIDCLGRSFETDKDITEDYEPQKYAKVYLYGCPKCKSVQFSESNY
jgi:phage FluMu protein Com